MERLTDLHCHIIPGVDDGAASWEDSAAMLHQAWDSAGGRITLIATPHVALSRAASEGQLARRAGEFASFARKELPGLKVGYGAEVLLDAFPTGRRVSGLATYPGSDWMLVELPQRLSWPLSLLRLWMLSRRVERILLAHPERYRWCAASPGRLAFLRRFGIRSQVTGRSLERGGAGVRDTALGLLEDGLCDIFASDCHHPGDGTLASFEDLVSRKAGRQGWETLSMTNPMLVLDNADICTE